jgi:hypothetical protein
MNYAIVAVVVLGVRVTSVFLVFVLEQAIAQDRMHRAESDD